MQVGDLVRFKDISSMCDNGKRMFPQFDGKVGIVIALSLCPSGNEMASVLLNGSPERFNRRYYEVVNATR